MTRAIPKDFGSTLTSGSECANGGGVVNILNRFKVDALLKSIFLNIALLSELLKLYSKVSKSNLASGALKTSSGCGHGSH